MTKEMLEAIRGGAMYRRTYVSPFTSKDTLLTLEAIDKYPQGYRLRMYIYGEQQPPAIASYYSDQQVLTALDDNNLLDGWQAVTPQ